MSVSVEDDILQFMWDLFTHESQIPGASESDILFSPISIVACLAMAFIGAKGFTFHQFLKVFYFTALIQNGDPNCNDGSNLGLHEKIGQALQTVTASDLITMADRIYLDKRFDVAPSFLSLAQQAYKSSAEQVNFQNEPSLAEQYINKWVSSQTNGMIPNLLSGSVTSQTVMVLVNAIYFKGNWKTQFNPSDTQNDTFHSLSSDIIVPMMSMKNKMRYIENTVTDIPAYKAVALPFAKSNKTDSTLSFVVILPDDMRVFSNAILSQKRSKNGPLSNGLWLKTVFSSLLQSELQEVNLKLPRFRMAPHGGSIKSILQGLGLSQAFSPHADFSGMTIKNSQQLALSDVVHQAVMEVDEEGAEAAAATGAGIVVLAMPLTHDVTVNKPAFVAIIDDKTAAPIFFGQLNKPQEL